MDAKQLRKRRRAAVACTLCHNRKVRCNVSLQGVPCSNCAQDGTQCRVYGQNSIVARFEEAPRKTPVLYPLTPSPDPVKVAEFSDKPIEVPTASQATITATLLSTATPDHTGRQQTQVPSQPSKLLTDVRRVKPTESDAASTLVPYYCGEVAGLEFLLDTVAPDRHNKGGLYIIARNVHQREWYKSAFDRPGAFPPASVRDQLIKCFFHYVYPFLPVVNTEEFLTKYSEDPELVSGMLLWSIFFASANYLGADEVKSAGFKSRKSLKEYCYQNAKVIFDSQQESDKTSIISAALLLGFWYVDLEDLDGCWGWIAVASNLAQSIGLHREPNYHRMPPCPFSSAQQALWRRLWWCCYYRDAWLALAFGRPMRLHLDDCDVRLPSFNDIADLKDTPHPLTQRYMAPELEALAGLWIKLIGVSIKLEEVLSLHYRPRRPVLSLAQIEKDNAQIVQFFDMSPQETEYSSPCLTLHFCHLKCYVNAVIITLHRSYIISTPEYLTQAEQSSLKTLALQRCKNAAASTTNVINRLIGLNLVELSPTMLVTGMSLAMQIHFYEYAQSESLARQHAYHNLNLHLIVLSYLQKTFWSADKYHNLYTELLKALDEARSRKPPAVVIETPQPELPLASRPPTGQEDYLCDMPINVGGSDFGGTSLENFFWNFNSFSTIPSMFEQSISVDWATANPLRSQAT